MKPSFSKQFILNSKIVEPLHSPDGDRRGGADAASLGGPLVMQVVVQSAINQGVYIIFIEEKHLS